MASSLLRNTLCKKLRLLKHPIEKLYRVPPMHHSASLERARRPYLESYKYLSDTN